MVTVVTPTEGLLGDGVRQTRVVAEWGDEKARTRWADGSPDDWRCAYRTRYDHCSCCDLADCLTQQAVQTIAKRHGGDDLRRDGTGLHRISKGQVGGGMNVWGPLARLDIEVQTRWIQK